MFFHVNTRNGCVVLTYSSVKHSFNPQAAQLLLCLAGLLSTIIMFSSKFTLVYVLILSWYIPSSFPWHNSENACLNKNLSIISSCTSKEGHFPSDNFCQEFAYRMTFIQYALVCPFRLPTYLQHSLVASHFSCLQSTFAIFPQSPSFRSTWNHWSYVKPDCRDYEKCRRQWQKQSERWRKKMELKKKTL